VWSLRRHWPEEKRRIWSDLLAGQYRFALLDRITLADGSDIDLWSARDALVLEALTMVLADVLPVSPLRCRNARRRRHDPLAVWDRHRFGLLATSVEAGRNFKRVCHLTFSSQGALSSHARLPAPEAG